MGRAELVILLSVLLVGAGAFALERLGPDAVHVIAISVCLLLIVLMVLGLVVRVRVKKRRARDEGHTLHEALVAEGDDPPPPA